MENKERVPKLLKFPIDLFTLVEAYRTKNEIKTFAGAVYQLLRIGLDQEK